MEKLDELIEQMRSSPQNVRYADACTVANAFFGEPRQRGASHRVWKMPWAGDPRVNMQTDKGGRAKAYQVHQLLNAIDRWKTERALAAQPKSEAATKGTKKAKRKKR